MKPFHNAGFLNLTINVICSISGHCLLQANKHHNSKKKKKLRGYSSNIIDYTTVIVSGLFLDIANRQLKKKQKKNRFNDGTVSQYKKAILKHRHQCVTYSTQWCTKILRHDWLCGFQAIQEYVSLVSIHQKNVLQQIIVHTAAVAPVGFSQVYLGDLKAAEHQYFSLTGRLCLLYEVGKS